MGIDTVKLSSPRIGEGLATLIEGCSQLRTGIDCTDGQILYEIFSGQIDGSFDSRISFKVARSEFVNIGGSLKEHPCDPYLVIECSVAKVFFGQNVYGSPTDIYYWCHRLVDVVGWILAMIYNVSHGGDYQLSLEDFQLPSADGWQVHRVDWAECYALSPEAIKEFFRTFSHVKYPRRQCLKYGTTGLYFPGSVTTLKFYHKGEEFKEHDYDRIKRNLALIATNKFNGTDKQYEIPLWVAKRLSALQRLANNRLRVEVEIKSRKLRDLFEGRLPYVYELTDEILQTAYDADVIKLLKEGESNMETVRNHEAVRARLISLYTKRSANSLLTFWMRLAAEGEDLVRIDYSKSQFYSNRKLLVDSGISWNASNLYILPEQTALPVGFAPLRRDPRRVFGKVRNQSLFDICPVGYRAIKLEHRLAA